MRFVTELPQRLQLARRLVPVGLFLETGQKEVLRNLQATGPLPRHDCSDLPAVSSAIACLGLPQAALAQCVRLLAEVCPDFGLVDPGDNTVFHQDASIHDAVENVVGAA